MSQDRFLFYFILFYFIFFVVPEVGLIRKFTLNFYTILIVDTTSAVVTQSTLADHC